MNVADFSGKTFLILSGGTEAVPGISSLKNARAKLVIFDANPDAPAKPFADIFKAVDIYDETKVISAIKASEFSKIDGVLSIGTDNPKSISCAKKVLGLSNVNERASKIATNKYSMNNVLHSLGLKSGFFLRIRGSESENKNLPKFNRPYVLKPIDSRGSRGVYRIHSRSEFDDYLIGSLNFSKSGWCVLEEWLSGPQLSAELLVFKGKSFLCGLADRNYSSIDRTAPFIIENGGETPSIFSSNKNQKEIELISDKVIANLQMSNGSIKFDLVYHKNKFLVIEFATRLSGGAFSTKTIPAVYNYDLIGNLAKIELGLEPDFPEPIEKNYKFQINRFIFPRTGKIKEVYNNVRMNRDILNCEVYVKPGDVTSGSVSDHTQRSGHVNLVGNSRAECLEKMQRILKDIVIEYE